MTDYKRHISPYHNIQNAKEELEKILEENQFSDSEIIFQEKIASYPDKNALKSMEIK